MAASLGAFRASFGALMLVHVARLHVHSMYQRSVLEPAFHFHFLPPPWDRLLAPSVPHHGTAHLVLLGASALALALGLHARLAAAVFAILYALFVLSERSMFNNHYYLYTILAALLALVGANDTLALDAVRARARGRPLAPMERWKLRLLRLQIVLVYAFAALAKCNCDWLLAGEPMRTKLWDEVLRPPPPLSLSFEENALRRRCMSPVWAESV